MYERPPLDITALPPRIAVVGPTGSGKTTTAGRLARITGAEHVEMDALFWEPNWTKSEPEVFRARIGAALDRAAWVTDGNYSVVRDLIWPHADMLVWLDYPFVRVFLQLFRRTARRGLRRQELWSGNRESLRTAFMTRDSLFVWLAKSHGKHRKLYPVALREQQHAHLRVVRMPSPGATSRWLANLERSAATSIC